MEGFFPGVDLEYNRQVLTEIGLPEEFAQYLKEINQSIVKLSTAGDLVDETSDRKVLLNTDGTLNQNLPKELIEEFQRLLSKKDRYEVSEVESSSLGKELQRNGYVVKKTKGIAQGGATSCGISTLNLKELFTRYPSLIMYADDGLLLPDSLVGFTPNLSVPAAGVDQALEKSR